MLHIVLYQPEIPQNTGNIARTCVGFNAVLHLIKPYGFFLDNKSLLRSGVDYWKHLQLCEHLTFQDFLDSLKSKEHLYFFTRYGTKTPSAFCYPDLNKKDVYLVFGKESKGIDPEILKQWPNSLIRIPSSKNIRSFNLSNCVAMCAYEVVKQNQYDGLCQREPHKIGFLKLEK